MLPNEADFTVYFTETLLPVLEQWEAERLKLVAAKEKQTTLNNRELVYGLLIGVGILFLGVFALVSLSVISSFVQAIVYALLTLFDSVLKLGEQQILTWSGMIAVVVCFILVILGLGLCVFAVIHFEKKKREKSKPEKPNVAAPISDAQAPKFKDMKAFTTAFKNDIIPRVASFFLTDASYSAKQGFTISDVTESGLACHPVNYLVSEDLIQGQLNGIQVSFGDLYAEAEIIFKRNLTLEKMLTGEPLSLEELLGKHQYVEERRRFTLLKGIFVKASFNKQVKGRVVVLPEAKKYESEHHQLQPVSLDHPEFEKRFKVFANDPQLSYYTLSLSFMERLLAFTSHFQESTPSFGMHQETLYIELRGKPFLFEKTLTGAVHESVNGSVTRYDFIKTAIFDELHRVLKLVDTLDLDTTIWAK
jgi:hypothetical protein